MSGVNKVILLGNLGKDPEVRRLESGSTVANFSIATTETYKDREGQRKDVTEWHDIELWEGLAKIAEQYLKKGDQIYLEGKMKSDTWKDESGNNRKKIKIRGLSMTMLRKGGDTSNETQNNAPSKPSKGEIDDLPF